MSDRGILRTHSLRARPLYNFRMPDRDRWYDPDFAPMNIPFRCEACDNEGPYTLPMLCLRTPSGWINARTGTALHVTVTGWRYP